MMQKYTKRNKIIGKEIYKEGMKMECVKLKEEETQKGK
jgi:hypothetical protein